LTAGLGCSHEEKWWRSREGDEVGDMSTKIALPRERRNTDLSGLHHPAKHPESDANELADPMPEEMGGANACDGDKQAGETLEAGLNVMRVRLGLTSKVRGWLEAREARCKPVPLDCGVRL
jgi:hypothetical protein